MLETRKRSIVKALSWRAIATLITATVAFALTGDFAIAVEVGLFDTCIKLGVFYAHERAWLRVRFGRVEPGDYQI